METAGRGVLKGTEGWRSRRPAVGDPLGRAPSPGPVGRGPGLLGSTRGAPGCGWRPALPEACAGFHSDWPGCGPPKWTAPRPFPLLVLIFDVHAALHGGRNSGFVQEMGCSWDLDAQRGKWAPELSASLGGPGCGERAKQAGERGSELLGGRGPRDGGEEGGEGTSCVGHAGTRHAARGP